MYLAVLVANTILHLSNLNPGGWVELQDYDNLIRSDDGTATEKDIAVQWVIYAAQAAAKLNREARPGLYLEQWAKDAGFINVKHRVFKIPVNGWPRDPKFKLVGEWMRENVTGGLDGMSMRLMCDVLGWTEAEVHVFLAGVRKQLNDRSFHGYWNW